MATTRITTLSADYELDHRAIAVFARWNYRSQKPERRLVGYINWDKKRGPFREVERGRLEGDGVRLVFDDFHCRVQSTGDEPVTYSYHATFDAQYAVRHGEHMRIYLDDEAGFQHMAQGRRLSVRPGWDAGFSALPSRPLDTSRLYGDRPHVLFCYGVADATDHDDLIIEDPDQWLGKWESRGFGVLVLWNHFYTRAQFPETEPIRYYEVDPAKRDNYEKVIAIAKARGWKVITYFESHHFHERQQDLDVTSRWMDQHQEGYKLDGWYFDGWRVADQWFRNYDWAKRIRAANDIVYVHNTVDVWGAWSGVTACPQLALSDYCLHGERIDLTGFDDEYFEFITQSRSGAIPDHKLGTGSLVTWSQLYSVQGVYGTARQGLGNNTDPWDQNFVPTYSVAKANHTG